MKKLLLISRVLLLVQFFTSTQSLAAQTKTQKETLSVWELVARNPELQILRKAFVVGDMTQYLQNATDITLFAPSNAAFEKWPIEELMRLMQHQVALQTLLEFHIAEERVSYSDALDRDYVRMLNGGLVSVMKEGDGLMIDDAMIIVKDIPARNGVIHVIDTVLEP